MGALLALIPSRDWFYGALIVGLGCFIVYERYHLIAEGKAETLAALQKSSVALTAKAQAQIVATATAYTASAAKITGDLDAQVKAAAALHVSDAERLREYDAYRRNHPALAGTVAPGGTQSAGSSGPSTNDAELASLEQVALGLATSGREVNAALSACMAERESIDGK
jgi:hypothetical protein